MSRKDLRRMIMNEVRNITEQAARPTEEKLMLDTLKVLDDALKGSEPYKAANWELSITVEKPEQEESTRSRSVTKKPLTYVIKTIKKGAYGFDNNIRRIISLQDTSGGTYGGPLKDELEPIYKNVPPDTYGPYVLTPEGPAKATARK